MNRRSHRRQSTGHASTSLSHAGLLRAGQVYYESDDDGGQIFLGLLTPSSVVLAFAGGEPPVRLYDADSAEIRLIGWQGICGVQRQTVVTLARPLRWLDQTSGFYDRFQDVPRRCRIDPACWRPNSTSPASRGRWTQPRGGWRRAPLLERRHSRSAAPWSRGPASCRRPDLILA